MTTKVTARGEESPEFRRRMAAVLHFLVDAQRDVRKHSLNSIAKEHGTQRSNLSAYIRTGGERRNIAFDRLRKILFALGVHWDFALKAQLHRWDVGLGEDAVEGLDLLAKANRVARAKVIPTLPNGDALVVFVAIETEAGAKCLLRVPQPLLASVCDAFDIGLPPLVAEARLSGAVQSAWMATDDRECEQQIRRLLGGVTGGSGATRTSVMPRGEFAAVG